jgi:hypothetical protein
MKLPKYPLEQLVQIKKKRLEEAEKKLKEKKLLLEKELEKLKKLETEAQEVHDHKQEKIEQLNEEMNQGTYSHKVETAHKYLKVVEERLKEKKKKVLDQDKAVKTAQTQVEIARQEMLKKQQDVEKLDLHYKEWKTHMLHEIAKKEANEADEMGSAKFSTQQREKKQQEHLRKKRLNQEE